MSETTPFPIRHWSEEDRPREKFQSKGKSVLSDAELLAIIIGSGTRKESAVELSKRILSSVHNNLNELASLSLDQLMTFNGIGQVKAISISAALELCRRKRLSEVRELSRIGSSRDVFSIMQPVIGELGHEEFWVLYLNNSNKVLHREQLSKGGITGTVVDVRLAFKTALRQGATGIILCHNHPSGGLKPSEADRQITRKMKAAGENLDIKVLDHLIITAEGYYSFSDEGIL